MSRLPREREEEGSTSACWMHKFLGKRINSGGRVRGCHVAHTHDGAVNLVPELQWTPTNRQFPHMPRHTRRGSAAGLQEWPQNALPSRIQILPRCFAASSLLRSEPRLHIRFQDRCKLRVRCALAARIDGFQRVNVFRSWSCSQTIRQRIHRRTVTLGFQLTFQFPDP